MTKSSHRSPFIILFFTSNPELCNLEKYGLRIEYLQSEQYNS